MKECYTYYRQLREELDRWLSQSIRMDIVPKFMDKYSIEMELTVGDWFVAEVR